MEGKPFKCGYCDHATKSAAQLNKHVQVRHLNIKPHKCTHCDYASGKFCEVIKRRSNLSRSYLYKQLVFIIFPIGRKHDNSMLRYYSSCIFWKKYEILIYKTNYHCGLESPKPSQAFDSTNFRPACFMSSLAKEILEWLQYGAPNWEMISVVAKGFGTLFMK